VSLERVSLERVSVEITPAPSDAERAAILAALGRLREREGDCEPEAWWAAGLPGAGGED
jgi:hypothetical protein